MANNKTLDFTAYQHECSLMTIRQIGNNIEAIRADLKDADAHDRAGLKVADSRHPACLGGYLRDKISVLSTELVAKKNNKARCHTVKLTSLELDMVKEHRKRG
jgi:hypothetical protein